MASPPPQVQAPLLGAGPGDWPDRWTLVPSGVRGDRSSLPRRRPLPCLPGLLASIATEGPPLSSFQQGTEAFGPNPPRDRVPPTRLERGPGGEPAAPADTQSRLVGSRGGRSCQACALIPELQRRGEDTCDSEPPRFGGICHAPSASARARPGMPGARSSESTVPWLAAHVPVSNQPPLRARLPRRLLLIGEAALSLWEPGAPRPGPLQPLLHSRPP